MSADLDVIREAARLMRDRATAANPNPWARPDLDLALADWLDAEANLHYSAKQAGGEMPDGWSLRVTSSTLPQAVAVARAYLGERP
ncbi:hypothetical protein ACH4T9_12345 [Micromonospora sp. NPDC020750]|uniref:hypothetical protein n=1 Tax=unclassified Micromonospora TaxID=2617518 RepID=UPI0037B5B68A